jgi:small subunit ribosomal protein S17
VRIEETAPISKLKTWKVIERVNTHATPERATIDG